jgi:hypothetical protein
VEVGAQIKKQIICIKDLLSLRDALGQGKTEIIELSKDSGI